MVVSIESLGDSQSCVPSMSTYPGTQVGGEKKKKAGEKDDDEEKGKRGGRAEGE